MTPLQRAAEALLSAAERLDRALDAGDPLEEALAGRALAFAELRAAARAPLPAEVRTLLERVVALDRSMLERAAAALAAAREGIGEVRRARLAVRALPDGARPPRLVSQRA